jgi:hypothetical protein
MWGRSEIAEYLRAVGAKEAWEMNGIDIPGGHAAIIKSFEKNSGNRVASQIVDNASTNPPIAIFVIPASKGKERQTVFTVGMSDRAINVPGRGPTFSELAMYLPGDWPLSNQALNDPNWNWPVKWIQRIALYPHGSGSWPNGPSAVFHNEDPPMPLAPNTQLSCLLCLEDRGFALPDARTVNVFSAYAIYTEEMELEKRDGTRRLIELFEKEHIPRAVAIGRPNVAKK